MNCFKGKVAIVTGGASGIGQTTCEELTRRGADVIVADINLEGAEKVSSSISRNGTRAWAVHLDVTEEDKVQKLVDETAAEHGRLDYIFNNAGIDIGGEARDLSREQWERVLDVNLMRVIYGSTSSYSLMVKQGFGHIVNTASLCGIIPVPIQVPYVTAKYAVVGLSNSLRAEGAGLGVKVSVFCPGVIQTPLIEKSTIVNSSMAAMMKDSPLKVMNVEDAVRVLLKGVERNLANIVCPFQSRLTWWFYRAYPPIMDNLSRKHAHNFRKKHRSPK